MVPQTSFPSNSTTVPILKQWYHRPPFWAIYRSSSPTSTWYRIWYPSPNTIPRYPSPNNVKVCVPYWSHSQYMCAMLVSFPVYVCHAGLIPSICMPYWSHSQYMCAILVSFPVYVCDTGLIPSICVRYWSHSQYACHTGLIPSMHAILVSFPPPEVSQHYLQHQHFGPLLWWYNCCHMYTDSIQ